MAEGKWRVCVMVRTPHAHVRRPREHMPNLRGISRVRVLPLSRAHHRKRRSRASRSLRKSDYERPRPSEFLTRSPINSNGRNQTSWVPAKGCSLRLPVYSRFWVVRDVPPAFMLCRAVTLTHLTPRSCKNEPQIKQRRWHKTCSSNSRDRRCFTEKFYEYHGI